MVLYLFLLKILALLIILPNLLKRHRSLVCLDVKSYPNIQKTLHPRIQLKKFWPGHSDSFKYWKNDGIRKEFINRLRTSVKQKTKIICRFLVWPWQKISYPTNLLALKKGHDVVSYFVIVPKWARNTVPKVNSFLVLHYCHHCFSSARFNWLFSVIIAKKFTILSRLYKFRE